MGLRDLSLVILDIQTTGFVPQLNHIVEMAWAKLEPGLPREKKGSTALQNPVVSSLVKLPEGVGLSKNVREITGLCDADFTNARPLDELLKKLNQTIGSKCPLLCHYARFEKCFLDIHGGKYFANADYICTFEIAKRLYPDLPCRNLAALAGHFGHSHISKKRASSHVHGTYLVWEAMMNELEINLGISTQDELQEWLKVKPIKRKGKMQFQIAKKARDELPQRPGVYRFLNSKGEILYIGKAINLRQRIKSYFQESTLRGRKKEMMTQASEIKCDYAENEIHASLIETDLIKLHSPPYNTALQEKGRSIYFFSEDYLECSTSQDSQYVFGPYTQPQDFSGFQAAVKGVDLSVVGQLLFYGFVSENEFTPGWRLFLDKYFQKDRQLNMRSLLALGLKFFRFYVNLEDHLEDNNVTEEESVLEASSPLEHDDVPYTPEEVCEKIERRVTGLAKQYLRAKAVTAMLNSSIHWSEKDTVCTLEVCDGKLITTDKDERPNGLYMWQSKSIRDYDRVRILLTEVLLRLRRGDEISWNLVHSSQGKYLLGVLSKEYR